MLSSNDLLFVICKEDHANVPTHKVINTGLSTSFFRRYQKICLYRAGPKPHIHFPHYLNISNNGKQTCFTSCKQRRYQQDETSAATKMPATAKFTSNMYGSPAEATGPLTGSSPWNKEVLGVASARSSSQASSERHCQQLQATANSNIIYASNTTRNSSHVKKINKN
jgi:hypothetical protein